jgi:hypothetical protein
MICEVDAYFKSRIHNAPPKMKKPELKKWCTQFAMKLCEERKDTESYKIIEKAKKSDDFSDCMCYVYGWWRAMNEGIQTIKKPI